MIWVYGLICLIFLIIFHEFGHFIAAKICGVKVESFSVGFGPVLLHKTIKGTDYRLSLLPLGGYCGMKGEKDFEKALNENQPFIQAEKDSLYGVHPLKRALIAFFGPFFNFIFAILAFSLINLIGYSYSTYSNKIIIPDTTENLTSIARDAGILTGDIILKVNNIETPDFASIVEQVSTKPDEDITLTIDRNGQLLDISLHTKMNKQDGTGQIGIKADTENTITKMSETYSFFPSIGKGFLDTINCFTLTIKSIGMLFKGVDIKNAVSGPIRVTNMLGTSIKDGFAQGVKNGFCSIFSLMAIISISLFVMNLLPVPILDGGLILFALIEFIFRKKINPKVQYYVQFIGLFFILFLLIIGLNSDITYFISRRH